MMFASSSFFFCGSPQRHLAVLSLTHSDDTPTQSSASILLNINGDGWKDGSSKPRSSAVAADSCIALQLASFTQTHDTPRHDTTQSTV